MCSFIHSYIYATTEACCAKMDYILIYIQHLSLFHRNIFLLFCSSCLVIYIDVRPSFVFTCVEHYIVVIFIPLLFIILLHLAVARKEYYSKKEWLSVWFFCISSFLATSLYIELGILYYIFNHCFSSLSFFGVVKFLWW